MIARNISRSGLETVRRLWFDYQDRLRRFAQRIVGNKSEAEDIVQEVFLRMNALGEKLKSETAPGWAYAVTYRLAIDRKRSQARFQRALSQVSAATDKDAQAALAQQEELDRLQQALLDLPEPYRSALSLRYLEGHDFPHIARAMETSERTARTWVGRGLSKLREHLWETP